jgi:hypothetical protein
MEQKTKNILAIAGGFLLWQAYRLYTAFKRLEYGISGISFKGLKEGAIMLNVGLWIKNTTPIPNSILLTIPQRIWQGNI